MQAHPVFLLIVIVALFSSCTVFPPNGPNVPLFRERGEKMVNANLLAAPEVIGIEAKGAIATGDKFYLSANASYISFGEGYHGLMTEIGAGSYGSFNRTGVFDISGGVGYGVFQHDQFAKLYLQPSLGIRREEAEFAAGVKGTYLYNKVDLSAFNVIERQYIVPSTSDFIVEPFMLARFGGEKTKIQLGLNFPTVAASGGTTTVFTVGAIYRFGKVN